jgi:hypothetical protein
MMKILHLLWIIPTSAMVGFLFSSLLGMNKEDN